MVGGQFLAESIENKEEIRSLLRVREPYKDKEDEILDMLVSSGALLRGHFKLESGKDTDICFRFSSVAGRRSYVERIADILIAKLKADRVSFDAVIMQEAAGRVLGGTIADKLNKRKIIVETDDRNRPTETLINETTLYPGDRVLIVCDLSTTGEGLRKMAKSVRWKKAVPVAIALFATRDKKAMLEFEQEQGLKVYAVADLAFEGRTTSPADCQLCREHKPFVLSWET